jgi:hypothetical protein
LPETSFADYPPTNILTSTTARLVKNSPHFTHKPENECNRLVSTVILELCFEWNIRHNVAT